MKQTKVLNEEIRQLRHKKQVSYKLYHFVNPEEKKSVRRQIRNLEILIRLKRSEIKKIKNLNLLDTIYNQLERKIARERMFI